MADPAVHVDDGSGVSERPPAPKRVRQVSNTLVETHTQTLAPELLAEASWRLGWLGLIYALVGIFGHFGRRALTIWGGTTAPALHPSDVIAIAGVLLGLGVFAVARHGNLPPKRLLDLGLVFEVAGAFGIASSQLLGPGARIPDPSLTLVPGECVWIVAYPLVVPNTPRKILAASLVAASMGPLTLALSSLLSGSPPAAPFSVAAYFLPNYLSAVVAYACARIVHRFNS